MSGFRIPFGIFKTPRPPRSTRQKSTLEDLTRRSRVKPPEPELPAAHKPGLNKFSRVLQWTLVPGVFGYMALYADFGEHEHIFSPLRRWVQRSKHEFLQLSPEEKRIVQSEVLHDPAESKKGVA